MNDDTMGDSARSGLAKRSREGGRRPDGGASTPTSKADGGGKDGMRKGGIVNRKGPSEIDRVLRAAHERKGGSPARQWLADGSVATGTVVRLDRVKGYGFLVDPNGQERFFHRSSVLDGGFDALKEQQSVEFQAVLDKRGARAVKVRPSKRQSSGAARQMEKPSAKTPAGGWHSDLMPFRGGVPRGSRGTGR